MTTPATKEDIARIEEKLDAIIDFFNIGRQPGRSRRDIDAWASQVVVEFNQKKRKSGGSTGK